MFEFGIISTTSKSVSPLAASIVSDSPLRKLFSLFSCSFFLAGTRVLRTSPELAIILFEAIAHFCFSLNGSISSEGLFEFSFLVSGDSSFASFLFCLLLRYHIRGVHRLVFSGLPENAVFYPEILSFLYSSTSEDATVDTLCLSVYTQYDALALERIVGSDRVSQLLQSPKNTHMFC